MKKIPFARPFIGHEEKQAVADVLDGHILVHGPRTLEFEKKFARWTGCHNSVSVSSCTAGLHLAYFNLGIGPGDEVIVPAMTHVATAHAVELTGAKPVFVDAEIKTGNIDIDKIEEAITSNTKALSIVHFLGMPVDMDRINQIAAKHNLFVVEDAALAFGSKFKGTHAGLLGDIGVFSMYPVKHITTLEGGLILSKHSDVLKKTSLQRAFGVDRTHAERKIPGQYDVNMLGLNYRMNELQAALGICQIDRLDDFLRTRKKHHDILSEKLIEAEGVHQFLSSHGDFLSSYYCKSVILTGGLANNRLEIIQELSRRDIGTSIYYPCPVPRLTYYKEKYGFQKGQFKVAETIAYQSIALPVGPHLGKGDAEHIAETFLDITKKYS